MTDEPVQVFYNTNFTVLEVSPTPQKIVNTTDFMGTMKVHMLVEARNQILYRFENIDDLFDKNVQTDLPTFNVKQYASDMYAAANNGTEATSVTVTERTLINNQDYDEWLTQKYTWKTEDDTGDASWPEDSGDDMVLQPQRIRLYRVIYNAALNVEMQ